MGVVSTVDCAVIGYFLALLAPQLMGLPVKKIEPGVDLWESRIAAKDAAV